MEEYLKRIEKSEPYGSYERALNGIYEYYKVIFNKKIEEKSKYEKSLEEMSKRCDCKKYVCQNEGKKEIEDGEEIEDIESKMKKGIMLKNEYII